MSTFLFTSKSMGLCLCSSDEKLWLRHKNRLTYADPFLKRELQAVTDTEDVDLIQRLALNILERHGLQFCLWTLFHDGQVRLLSDLAFCAPTIEKARNKMPLYQPPIVLVCTPTSHSFSLSFFLSFSLSSSH